MAGDRKKKEDEEPGAPAWMVTYGDLMSLLLTFFVLLLSFSTVSEKKYSQAIQSLKGALGGRPHNLSAVTISTNRPEGRPKRSRSIEKLARRLKRELQVKGKQEEIDVKLDEQGGLKISLPSKILFDSARAELKADAAPVLADLAGLLADVPAAQIEVRGHTDSRPLTASGRYRDNYDLSYDRAKSVMAFLNSRGEIPREQFEVIALGPSKPVATNETEEGMQANRRVDLYVRGELSEETVERVRDGSRALEERPA